MHFSSFHDSLSLLEEIAHLLACYTIFFLQCYPIFHDVSSVKFSHAILLPFEPDKIFERE
jgi:hypothetical protein